MTDERIEHELSGLTPPVERPGFFELLAERAWREHGSAVRRRRVRSLAVSWVSVAAVAAACWLFAFGSPFVDRASGGGRISYAALSIVDRTYLCHSKPETLPIQIEFQNSVLQQNPPQEDAGMLAIMRNSYLPMLAVTGGPTAIPMAPEVVASQCARSKRSIPLSSKGLPRPAIRYGNEYTCSLVHRVIGRVRTVTEGRKVVAAFISVAKENGKLLAFGSLDRQGQGGMFVSNECTKP